MTGCAVADYFTVTEAQRDLPGLSAADLRLCAGLPERTAKGGDGREYWSYERSTATSTGTLTFAGLGINFAGAQECRATFELSQGRVARMAYARVSGPSACAPLVQTCASMISHGQVSPAPP